MVTAVGRSYRPPMTDADSPPPEPAAPSFLAGLGPRARHRPEPRAATAVAAAGCALSVLGILVLAGDASSSSDGGFNGLPGAVLSALVVVAGAILLQQVAAGPIATAGSVAVFLGVPATIFFATTDASSSLTPVLVLTTIAWLGLWSVGPARGRGLFLAGGLVGGWLSVLQVTEGIATAPFSLFLPTRPFAFDTGGRGAGAFLSPYAPGFGLPDPTNIALLSLAIGVVYLAVCRRLDRTGYDGAATSFAAVALPCLAVGVVFMAPDLHVAGAAALGVIVGLGLTHQGATLRRRATTWVGAGTAAISAAVLLGDVVGSVVVAGGLFAVAGIVLVVASQLFVDRFGEPDELLVTSGVRPLGPAAAGAGRG
jgi:hypothetical protein